MKINLVVGLFKPVSCWRSNWLQLSDRRAGSDIHSLEKFEADVDSMLRNAEGQWSYEFSVHAFLASNNWFQIAFASGNKFLTVWNLTSKVSFDNYDDAYDVHVLSSTNHI